MTPWREQVGTRAPRVTVFERPDKDMTVWLRWYVDRSAHVAVTEVRSVRDERGRLLKRRQDAARIEALEKWQEIHGVDRPYTGPLTWAQGIERAFGKGGCYSLDPSEDRHTADMLDVLTIAGRILGESTPWQAITPGKVRSLWHTMRDRYGGRGYRKAEKMVAALYTVSRWLEAEYPEQRFPRPVKGWRAQLRDDWAKAGSKVKPHRPRHSPEEVATLLRRRHEGDPRLALALTLGPELRGGQLVKTMRSHYDTGAGIQYRRGHMGRIDVPFDSDRKRAPRLWLNWRERLALGRAMRRGYLSDCEREYQAGALDDYALFPAGRLRKGKAVPERADTPARQESLVEWLHDLEAICEVPRVKGRGWHGLRRELSERYETATSDERVKDQLGGWAKGSTMRRATYHQDENPEVLEEAARLRGRHRT